MGKREEGKWRRERLSTCCEIVQGIKSPEALFPLERLFMIVSLEISPSRLT